MPLLCWTTSWFAADGRKCPSDEVDVWADANFSFQKQDRKFSYLQIWEFSVYNILQKESLKARNGCFATRQHIVQCFIEESGTQFFPCSYQPGCERECMCAPLCVHRIFKAGKDACSRVSYHWCSDNLFPISFLSFGQNPQTRSDGAVWVWLLCYEFLWCYLCNVFFSGSLEAASALKSPRHTQPPVPSGPQPLLPFSLWA